MQTLIGAALVGIPILLFVGATVQSEGLWGALAIWGGAIAITASMVAGISMLVPH